MIFLQNILKYLACVVLSMIGFVIFILVLDKNATFSKLDLKGDLPLYLGVGWGAYQGIFNKIHEQNLNYYWMIIKLGLQISAIIVTSFLIMRVI